MPHYPDNYYSHAKYSSKYGISKFCGQGNSRFYSVVDAWYGKEVKEVPFRQSLGQIYLILNY